MLEQSFPPASLDDGDDAKLKNAAEGILLALGLQGVEVKAVAMRGVNAISSQARGGGAVILVSREAVESLSKGELEALLAHEAYHISTQETRLWALGAGLSGVIMLAQSAERRRWYAKDLEEDAVFRALKEGSGYAGIMAMVLGYFMFVVFMPVWISYFIFFLPRDRDFLADEHAMLITKSPEDVISAIEKSQRSKTLAAKWGGLLFNHMFFNQPLCVHRGLAGFLARRLNIHPPSQERVARIRSMC